MNISPKDEDKNLISKVANLWRFVLLGIGIIICMGTVYSWSVFRTPISQMYSLDANAGGLPYLAFLILYTVFMLLSGFGLSPLITAPVIKVLINHVGVNSTFIAMGIFFLIAVPLLGFIFSQTRSSR